MTLAPQELENTASKFAAEAIKLDSQGSHSSAINSYQRASEALIKLVQIYPEYKLNRVYLERAGAYQNRIKAIQMANGILEDDRQPSGEPESKRNSIMDSPLPKMNSRINHVIPSNKTNLHNDIQHGRQNPQSTDSNKIQELSSELRKPDTKGKAFGELERSSGT